MPWNYSLRKRWVYLILPDGSDCREEPPEFLSLLALEEAGALPRVPQRDMPQEMKRILNQITLQSNL